MQKEKSDQKKGKPGEESQLAADKKERLKNALETGKAAYQTAGDIMMHLESAEQCGKIDFFGGAWKADVDKYAHLKIAGKLGEDLEKQAEKFREAIKMLDLDGWKESDDIDCPKLPEIKIGGFVKFMDYVFNVSLPTLKRIRQASRKVMEFRRKMEDRLAKLRNLSA